MKHRILYFRYLFVLLIILLLSHKIKAQSLESFIEYGATLRAGDNTPLWQVSNIHGFSSLKNNTYIRGGVFYNTTQGNWNMKAALDVGVTAGFTSSLILQQAFVEANYKWLGIYAGSKETDSPLLNQQLSSGGLTWSGNARPIPQVAVGLFDYVKLLSQVWFKAEISYGKLTDNAYQKKQVGEGYWYTKDIKYHHKSVFFRLGNPLNRWNFDFGLSMDCFFGGYNIGGGPYEGNLGNSLKDYWAAFFPRQDNSDELQPYYKGNFMGSEHLKVNYQHTDFKLSAYLENYYDDFSGVFKMNGLDGLWGVELQFKKQSPIDAFVLEYYQTTHQSGPLHGLDHSVVKKTHGADDYYNNHWYPGWAHWGMTMANPLVASPIYNKDGDMAFKYNRVKAIHLGWAGSFTKELSYRAKLSYNQTWGTPFRPTVSILENYSSFFECKYIPCKYPLWDFRASLAFDIGNIYGDNLGVQIKIRRKL